MRDKRSRWCNLHMTGSTHTPAYGHYRNKSSDTTLNMIARSSLFTVAHRAALDPTASLAYDGLATVEALCMHRRQGHVTIT